MRAFGAAVAGLLYVNYNKYIHPSSLSIANSAEGLLGVIAGGSGTLGGPIAGAALITIAQELLLGLYRALEHAARLRVLGHRAGCSGGNCSGPAEARGAQGRSKAMTAPALDIQNLFKKFGGLPATRNVTMRVEVGERRLILGPNGAGKTTLFNQITGDIAPTSGSIRLFGLEITGLPPSRRAHLGIARTYQIITLFQKDTLEHNVMLALLGLSRRRYDMFRPLASMPQMREKARRALGQVGLDQSGQRKVSDLSYGEKRRLEIALALAQEPKLLLLDEPMAGLSTEERTTVRNLIASIPRSTTLVMIEHDMDSALSLVDKVTLLHYGQVLADGDREAVVAAPQTREVYLGL